MYNRIMYNEAYGHDIGGSSSSCMSGAVLIIHYNLFHVT